MKSIAIFNNKGGVGKTTLACNLVSYLSLHKDKKVLLIDADPQCNATQAFLEDDVCEEIYTKENNGVGTLYQCLRPLDVGEPAIDSTITPRLASENRFETDIIPGHPKMSIMEDRLSNAWSTLKGQEVGGFRITNWCTHLLDVFRDQYDLIIFDVGPSLGALNRSVILSSDYIVTPFGCDIYSLLGIQNIKDWITEWKGDYDRAISGSLERDSNIFNDFRIIQQTDEQFRFAGYSVQQYVRKKFKEGHRPVKSYDRIMAEIPSTVKSAMDFLTPSSIEDANLELGHIPYVYSLVPMAQAAKAPIHDLKYADGVVGSQYQQVTSYGELMNTLCDRLLVNVECS